MQSGVLVALNYVAENPTEFVENFFVKSRKSVEAGSDRAPYAWVIPEDQLRTVGTRNLIDLLRRQGLEVHRATDELKWNEGEAEMVEAAGSYVVRLDQPYRPLALVLLDKQNFPEGANAPYDDTGWTLPFMHNVTAHKVSDAAILDAGMSLITEESVLTQGIIEGNSGVVYAINHTTDDNFALLRFELPNISFTAAEHAFEFDGQSFNAGTYLINEDGNPSGYAERLEQRASDLGLDVHRLDEVPDVDTHEVEVPRVGLIHTWTSTPQDAGWWRLAFDRIGIPYTYLSEQDLGTKDLRDFDVLIMPLNRSSPQQLVAGNSRIGEPTPWMPSDEYPSIGHIDQTTDTRTGMGYEGVSALKKFVEAGGLFITEGRSAAFPIDMALTRRVSIKRTTNLQARGAVARTVVADSLSPIIYGYGKELPAYFSQSPVFQINEGLGGATTPDWYKTALWEAEVPRVVMRFAKKDVNMSGMLIGESELANTPSVVDVPVGKGHVILFAVRPFRRWNTQGSHALVFNAMLHWNDLRTGWPSRPDPNADDKSTGPILNEMEATQLHGHATQN